MTHREALAETTHPPDCDGELHYRRREIRDGLHWSVNYCTRCGRYVAALAGRPHWYNHEMPQHPVPAAA